MYNTGKGSKNKESKYDLTLNKNIFVDRDYANKLPYLS